MANNDYIQLTSPRGFAVFPKLNTPDVKFDKMGIYSVQLRLNPADDGVSEFIDTLEENFQLSISNATSTAGKTPVEEATRPWTDELEDGKETGFILVRIKMKAGFVRDGEVISMRPHLFDAAGNTLDPDATIIGGGSELQTSFTVIPFAMTDSVTEGRGAKKKKIDVLTAGISLRMRAVLVHELRAGNGGNATSYGFDIDPSAAPIEKPQPAAAAQGDSALADFN